jgi:uracil-DNA glycosylase
MTQTTPQNNPPLGMPQDWATHLQHEFNQPYFKQIMAFLQQAEQNGVQIYPPKTLIFQALKATPLSKVKVVLLGQDPYHQPNQATGLSFSVPKHIKTSPSLRNVYKELSQTVDGFQAPNHGDISAWAGEGVLLLNASLTVEHNRAGSHANIGWQQVTDAIISLISQHCEHVVFMLWGSFAHKKTALIDARKHLILKAIHPSPLARGGFFGCNHFNLANQYLIEQGIKPIDWRLPL